MIATLDLTESNVMTILRAFILTILGTSVSVVEGQVNRVVSPVGNYVVTTVMLRKRLSQNITLFEDDSGGFELETNTGLDLVTHTGAAIVTSPRPPGLRRVKHPTELTVQLDVHGPNASNNSQIISTLIQDGVGCDAFDNAGLDVQLLYANDPRQTQFVTGESQYENRWTVEVVLQMNPIVSVIQPFADHVTVGLIEVDTTYP